MLKSQDRDRQLIAYEIHDGVAQLLAAAIMQFETYESIARWGIPIEFQHDVTFDRLDPSLENAIYRIAQESLANACQHSQSDKIQLELTQHGDTVQISVQDWGIGFDPQSAGEKCFGLAGIHQRAWLLGGHVSIATNLGQGSHIVVELPIGTGDVDLQSLDCHARRPIGLTAKSARSSASTAQPQP